MLEKIISESVYKSDYEEITTYFQKYPVGYDKVIIVLKVIIQSGIYIAAAVNESPPDNLCDRITDAILNVVITHNRYV